MSFRVQCSDNYYMVQTVLHFVRHQRRITLVIMKEKESACCNVVQILTQTVQHVFVNGSLKQTVFTCFSPFYDIQTDYTQCLPGRDITSSCDTCLPGYDPLTNCTECLTGRDTTTNCTTCLQVGYDPSTNVSQVEMKPLAVPHVYRLAMFHQLTVLNALLVEM